MMFSVNNKLILEAYVKEGLKAKIQGGIAIPGQRSGLKGLQVLVDTTLSNGKEIPKGSIAYIKEEALYTHAWASQHNTCDTIPGKFMIVDFQFIEGFDTPDGDAA